MLIDEGLEIVCEDGLVRGELAGLEVARILHGPDGPFSKRVSGDSIEAGALLHAGVTRLTHLRCCCPGASASHAGGRFPCGESSGSGAVAPASRRAGSPVGRRVPS